MGVPAGRRPPPGSARTGRARAGSSPRSSVGLGLERDRVQAHGHRVLVVVVLPRPRGRVGRGHLGVELDAPGRRVRQPEGLEAVGAAGQRDRPVGRDRHVGVPLEAHEPLGQRADQRVLLGAGLQRHLVPADLGRGGALDRAAGRLGHQLGAEAHAQRGHAAVQQLGHHADVLVHPRVRVGVVHVGGRAQHQRGVHAVERGRGVAVHPPGHQLGAGHLGEHAGPGVVLVDDREHAHGV